MTTSIGIHQFRFDAAPYDLRRRATLLLAGFSALTALLGGAELLLFRHGNRFVPLQLLEPTAFSTFLIPGLLLFFDVGGSSLLCTLFALRRDSRTIDATLAAGGILTFWIGLEVVQLRQLHFLHFLYAGVGLSLLLLGVAAARRSENLRHRWLVTVTAAESIGFLLPVGTAVEASRLGLGDVEAAFIISLAGIFEGLILGFGQVRVLPLPVRRFRYVALTGLSAGGVWAMALFGRLALTAGGGPPVWVLWVVVPPAALLGLAAIGLAQWLELRHHTSHAARWIWWSALAWLLALPMSFLPSPLVDEGTPLMAIVALWASAGVLMASVMAAVTYRGVIALVESHPIPAR